MEIGTASISDLDRPITLIVCAGFEERAQRSADLLARQGVRPHTILLLTYGGLAHDRSYELLQDATDSMAPASGIVVIPITDLTRTSNFLSSIPKTHLVVLDITALTRKVMFLMLSGTRSQKLDTWILYAEAEEYYPTRQEFQGLLTREQGEAFLNLKEYEDAELIYSGKCHVEEIPGYEGYHLPNYPLMLVSFLTFKRSRLAAILREYESNVRVLIEGVPIRRDLQWRQRLMEIINFDIIEDNRQAICKAETLDWKVTYNILSDLYNNENARYRFNVLLAPLGSKMQTLGAWAFAIRHREVKVVTSTPSKHFPLKYSTGFRETFLIKEMMDSVEGAPVS